MKIYKTINERLKIQHLVIPEIINDLDDELINRQPEKGEWSIKDNIAHIAYYHLRFLSRMELILKEKKKYFQRYNPDLDMDFIEWRKMSKTELLHKLKENRNNVIEYIENLNDEDLEKTGIHEKFGEMNIVQWIEFFLLHEAHHIFTIFKLSRTN